MGNGEFMPQLAILPAASAAIVAALSLIIPEAGEAADRVGVAAAVTPQATSKPAGGSTKTLKIGKSVFYNERITTSDTGVVQVLLVDGSTFMVGPKSDLVIDKFVYDPRSGTGTLAATFSKGALRFVGGKLSKNEPGVKVRTPAGELTVRGGIFQGIVRDGNHAVFAFVFGHYLALNRAGRRYTLRQTGNLFAIGRPGAPVMRETTAADTNLILAAVSGKSFGTKLYKIKGNAWPFYYGIQPTGRYPDEPFVRELYYNGANPIILHRVPEPKIPKVHVSQPTPTPPPRPPVQTPNTGPINIITGPGFTDKIP
jgi:FecR-like protein